MQLRTDNIIDENSLIEKCAFLSAFKDSQILKIYHLASHLDIKKDEILFDINTNDKSGLFILIDGQITFAKDNEGIVVKNIISGDLFNEHSIFYESKRSYSAKATKDSYVLFVKQDDFIKLTEQDKDIKKTFYEESSKTYNITKLEDIIRRIYGDDIEYDVIKEIVALGEFISLDNDNMLFDQGDKSDSIYFLIGGLLKVFLKTDSSYREIAEIHSGEPIGEMGILSDQPRSAAIYAARDSLVFKINKDDFNNILVQYPSVLFELTKQIIGRFIKQQNADDATFRTNIFSLIHLSKIETKSSQDIDMKLSKALNKISSCFVLNSSTVSELLNISDINHELELVDKYPPLQDLIFKLSKENRYILLSCDLDFSHWTKWALAVSETDVYAINSNTKLNNTNLFNQINNLEDNTPTYLKNDKQLLIYHNSRNNNPKNTSEYLDVLYPISRHYHIATNYENDFDRLARSLIGKSIGLCLAGGGAKGNAHIGVYKALLESNVPIDIACGTSAGGIVASFIASGYNPDEIVDMLKEGYKLKMFKEYTLPYSSIVATNKVEHNAKTLAEGKYIEDLWLPMFACAVDITNSELIVMDRGPLWMATRATGALPGILLPLIKGDSFLVDGGLINNMPGDIMLDKFGGKLISVSVSPEEDMVANFNKFPPQASYFIKKMIFGKNNKNEDIPNLADILMRSIMVSSSAKQLEVEKMSDLFLNPKVDNVGMLDFDSIDESVDLGYKHTMEELEKNDISKLLF
tara:strand:+ start:190 stop:2436 length:2247 start_codon:yes stop_codon:yes gene_type:complete